jgi:hypothetical protein
VDHIKLTQKIGEESVMKKVLVLCIAFLCFASAYADVELRLVFVSFSQNIGGIETLDVSLEAKANGYGYPIEKFQGSFDMGANMATQIAAGGSTSISNIFFTATNYDRVYNVTGSAVNYYFKKKTAGTAESLTDGSWVKIFDLQIQYQYIDNTYTTFTWSESTYGYSVEILAYFQLYPGGPYVSLPVSVTGGKIGMPSSLVDRSLPVQMNNFTGKFNFDDGIKLVWKTQGEMDCAGFHVVRSANENGPFSKITTAMIQAAGNSSSEREYSFTDKNVKSGSKYWYRVQEISSLPDATDEIYYGNLEVATLSPPEHFALKQNYPNPFNPDTKMAYDLPEHGRVVLGVYDILGKQVRMLVNDEKQPGSYEVVWDGMDDAGRTLPSGLYFYKLSAGEQTQIRKMMKIH